MQVVIRADASPHQGTGHVMRCLALSEELSKHGHEAYLVTNYSGIEWLEQMIEKTKVQVLRTQQHKLSDDLWGHITPDWVIVDSYEISPASISKFSTHTKLLAIVDGDTRGIIAHRYLDQNLEAEHNSWPSDINDRIWAGSKYSLVRDDFLKYKREKPWEFRKEIPHLVSFMGGTDPTGAIVDVSSALINLRGMCTATVVVAPKWQDTVEKLFDGLSGFEIIGPTPELPLKLASADIVVSASGTSTWDLFTLGIPAILVAVVENQLLVHNRITKNKLAMGIIRSRGGEKDVVKDIETMALRLIRDKSLREMLSQRCLDHFDGAGKSKIVEKLEENLFS